MNIRPAKHCDIPSLILLAEQFHAEDPAFSNIPIDSVIVEKTLADSVAAPNFCLLVAEAEAHICGFFLGHVSDSMWGPFSESFEDFFYVEPEYRSQAAGAQLLAAYVEWADGRGALIKGAGVRSQISEDAAFALLASAGFVPFGTLWIYRGH